VGHTVLAIALRVGIARFAKLSDALWLVIDYKVGDVPSVTIAIGEIIKHLLKINTRNIMYIINITYVLAVHFGRISYFINLVAHKLAYDFAVCNMTTARYSGLVVTSIYQFYTAFILHKAFVYI
jgi:hypothetical protein